MMIKVYFKPTFIKQFKKLETALQEEAFEKIELFKDIKNHKQVNLSQQSWELLHPSFRV